MFGSRPLALSALGLSLSLSAQTYDPKTIRLQGADGTDQAEVMRLVGLKPGAPVTKEQIEAAMQRLADSGLFADLSYRVDASALVFMLKPIAGAQALPVRYSNFVWWRPGELEPLVEARVPLFHGKLPLTGQLTTEVETALAALLADKGVTGAKVEAMQSTLGGNGIALTITQPPITVGQVHLTGVAPEASEQMNKVIARLAARDFDSGETPSTIVNNTLDTHRNAGYLDATVEAPIFTAPHPEERGYAVDAAANVHPGAMYHIAGLTFGGIDPKLEPEVAKASGLKTGDPAQEMVLRIAEGLSARALHNRGNLEAKAKAQVAKDMSAHTVNYTFDLTPGPVYTFKTVDLTALPAETQSRFGSAFHGQSGAVADRALQGQLMAALQSVGVLRAVAVQQRLDRSTHTVTYVIAPKASGRSPQGDTTPDQP